MDRSKKKTGKQPLIPEGYLTTTQAAEEANVTRQAIIQAIIPGRLKAIKINDGWYVSREELLIYQQSRWSRHKKRGRDGNLIYDPSQGRYSSVQAAQFMQNALGIPYPLQRIYNKINSGALEHTRYNSSYIIKGESLQNLLDWERDRRVISI